MTLTVANPSELPERVTAIQQALVADEAIIASLVAAEGITALTGDVTATGPGSAAATVIKATTSVFGKVKPDNVTLDVSGAGGDLEMKPVAGVAGTYTTISSITIDGFGRVTAITGT